MGALIQILEVGGELGIGVSAEMRKWSDADLKNSIGKRKKRLIQDGDGAAEEHQRNPRRHACCWPFARERKERLGFLEEPEEEEGKGSSCR